MKRVIWLASIAAVAALAADPSGIRPRPSASDYPAHDSKDGLTVGASVLPPSQAKNAFSTDLSKYVVVEVTVYPENGKSLDLAPQDFALRIGTAADIIRPANPASIAGAIHRKNSPQPDTSRGSDITLYPTATIGYESGGYDPVTGRRGGGWVTGAGVGVGIGGNQGPGGPVPPGSTERDRSTMQQELQDKGLPSGQVTAPVAGYLYFPLPEKRPKGAYELDYYGASGGKLRVLFPPVEKK